MKVKVILQKDFPTLGKKGDVKIVRMGYAKNFLLPQRIVILGTPKNILQWQKMKSLEQKELDIEFENYKTLKNTLNGKLLKFVCEAQKDGSLFAEFRKIEVIKKIKEDFKEFKDIELNKDQIEFSEKIKKTGEFNAKITLAKDIETNIKISIEPDTKKVAKAKPAKTKSTVKTKKTEKNKKH